MTRQTGRGCCRRAGCWTELREVGNWTSGGTPKSNEPDYYNGPISWFRITELNKGRLRMSEKTRRVGCRNHLPKLLTRPAHVCNVRRVNRHNGHFRN